MRLDAVSAFTNCGRAAAHVRGSYVCHELMSSRLSFTVGSGSSSVLHGIGHNQNTRSPHPKHLLEKLLRECFRWGSVRIAASIPGAGGPPTRKGPVTVPTR